MTINSERYADLFVAFGLPGVDEHDPYEGTLLMNLLKHVFPSIDGGLSVAHGVIPWHAGLPCLTIQNVS